MSSGNSQKAREKPLFVSKWDRPIAASLLEIEPGARFEVVSCFLVYNGYS